MTLLSEHQIAAALVDLPGWTRDGAIIHRSVKFPSFLDGIEAVRRVAGLAEAADHHPDIEIRWRTVRFALTTWSAGGITRQDIDLAREIDLAVSEQLS